MRTLIIGGLILLIVGLGCANVASTIYQPYIINPYTLSVTPTRWWENLPHQRLVTNAEGVEMCCVTHSDFLLVGDSLQLYVSSPFFITVEVRILVEYPSMYEQWRGNVRQASIVSLPLRSGWRSIVLVYNRDYKFLPIWRDTGINDSWILVRPWPLQRRVLTRGTDV